MSELEDDVFGYRRPIHPLRLALGMVLVPCFGWLLAFATVGWWIYVRTPFSRAWRAADAIARAQLPG